MHIVDIIILVGWVAFWIYWLAASAGVKVARSRWRRCAGVRIAIAAVVVVLVRLRAFDRHEVVNEPALQATGLALFVAGLGLAVWARRYLGRNWGMPMSEKLDPELVMTGPYRTIRHPIYSGIILAMVGTSVAVSPYWLVVAGLLGGYFVYSAFREERYLAECFPGTYPQYRRSTKMLIPYLF